MKLRLTMLVGIAAMLITNFSSCSQESITLSFDGSMTIDVDGTYEGKVDISYTDNDGKVKQVTGQTLPFTRAMQYEKSVKKVTVTISPTPSSYGSMEKFVEAELIGATKTYASKKEYTGMNYVIPVITLEHTF